MFAVPATEEITGIGLTAVRTGFFAARVSILQTGQGFLSLYRLRVIVHPYFGLSLHERDFAQCACSIGIENMCVYAETRQRIDGQLGIEQRGCNVDPFH